MGESRGSGVGSILISVLGVIDLTLDLVLADLTLRVGDGLGL